MAYHHHTYENSSFTIYGKGIQGSRTWVLPYRSTILWPIRKLLESPKSTPHRETLIEIHDVLGFLKDILFWQQSPFKPFSCPP